jgi:hypothetical protein
MGTPNHPVIIRAEGRDSEYVDDAGNPRTPDLRPRLRFPLILRSLKYVYLKNVRVIPNIAGEPHHVPPVAPDPIQAGDVVHVHTHLQRHQDPPERMQRYLLTDHILIRGCELDGGWRPGQQANEADEEVLKVNQCQSVFVEACQIHGTSNATNGNCVDFVAVQYGHVVDCHLYHARNWLMYFKGGSAYIRAEGNRLHGDRNPNGTLNLGSTWDGFSAGEGTNNNALVPPWLHYEAYAIQFVNNLVYDLPGTGIGVQGGYNILIAHNTLYNVGLGDPGDEVPRENPIPDR